MLPFLRQATVNNSAHQHITISGDLRRGNEIPSTTILGIRVHNVTMPEAIAIIESMVTDGNQHQIITANAEIIMAAQENEKYRSTLNGASLAFPDGMGVLLASKLIGKPLTERVTGVDATRHIADIARRRGFRLFLLGAAEGVAERAASKLRHDFPGVNIVGTYSGSPHPDEDKEICAIIERANPHIIFVAYGAPKQELWVARNLPKLNARIALSIGGTFDFIAGDIPRAPLWMQKSGLEWFFRLLQEPRRWRRMLALPRFAVAVVLGQLTRKASPQE